MVPAPPDFQTVTPLFHVWEQGEPIVRVYSSSFRENEFNPGRSGAGVRGRFHFFPDAAAKLVPVLYGSDLEDGAIAETIFHDVPVRGAVRTVAESRLDEAAIVTLEPRRDLELVEQLGFGLRRLQLEPGDLTATHPTEYPRTVLWAQALHQTFADIDGLVWMSKQFIAARALLLFGDRVRQADLAVARPAMPLRAGSGRKLVDEAANRAGIVIVG
ncbi:MAG: RES family NAD+ phosphorylase [Gemmatimonadetes bacterium]|nr:RES family NAD+ phosphorylase [Gemmatimonadota bacterium]